MARAIEAAAACSRDGRAEQQDAILILDPTRPGKPDSAGHKARVLVCAVADGMGGHAGGTEAAAITISALSNAVGKSPGDIGAAFRIALTEARRTIRDAEDDNPDLAGMGSTLVVSRIVPESVTWASVGDTPLYLFRNGRLERLNVGHSIRADGNEDTMLGSTIGASELKEIDAPSEGRALVPGDTVLLASDGILTLGNDALEACLSALNGLQPKLAVDAILSRIEDAGLTDQTNAKLILIRIPDSSGSGQRIPRIALSVLAWVGLTVFLAALFLLTWRDFL